MSQIEIIIITAICAAVFTQAAILLREGINNYSEGRKSALYLALMLEKYAEDCALIAWEGFHSKHERLPDFPNYRTDTQTKFVNLETLADIASVDLSVSSANRRHSPNTVLGMMDKLDVPRNAYWIGVESLDSAGKIRMRYGISHPENLRAATARSNLASAAKKLYIDT